MRKALFIFKFFVCGIVLTAGHVFDVPAAMAQNYNRNIEALSQLNRIDPRQNPEFDDSGEVLGRRVIDSKKKVIGDVRDIILSDSGNIEQLSVEFNRLRLNSNIFLNYSSMGVEPVSNGYAMAFNENQIEELYPTLLADIETAAGSEDVFSVRNVLGGAVKSQSGKQIGVVEDVLFGANGSRASALLVKLTQGTMRGDRVAVPFNSPTFENAGSRKNVIVSDDMANAILDFAKAN